MPNPETLADDVARRRLRLHARRINRALDHLDAHLDQEVNLARLAQVCHFSSWHFHRVFMAWTGETLAQHVHRRRMERAAQRLWLDREASVLAVALSVGWGSGEAFARAFKRHFGCTATQWRRDAGVRSARYLDELRARLGPCPRTLSNPGQDGGVQRGQDEGLFPPSQGATGAFTDMDVQIQTWPDTRIAYMRHIGAYGPAVAAFWRTQFLPWLAQSGLTGRSCFGIGHDDPGLTPASRCRYDAAVAVEPGLSSAHPAVGTAELPGGAYARLAFEGPAEAIGLAWARLLREWLPASGWRCDGRPCFEWYDPTLEQPTAAGHLRCWLCLPVCR
jgi:AraC family transcriptional regulator